MIRFFIVRDTFIIVFRSDKETNIAINCGVLLHFDLKIKGQILNAKQFFIYFLALYYILAHNGFGACKIIVLVVP